MTTKRYTPDDFIRATWSSEMTLKDVHAMLKQAAEDCEDAQRYRFARDHGKAFENYYGCEYHDIDQAIDRARTQEQAK